MKTWVKKSCCTCSEGIFYDLFCDCCFCDCMDNEVERNQDEMELTAEDLAASKVYVLEQLKKANELSEKMKNW